MCSFLHSLKYLFLPDPDLKTENANLKLQMESLQQDLQNTKDSENDIKSQLKKQLLEAQTEIIVLKQQAIENEKQVSLLRVFFFFFL